jgi:dephospho-CoA kinase
VTIRIGITGPIGCGKSTVAGWLGERPRVVVIEADVVAREVVGPGEPALAAIAERFGDGVLAADGSLDRGALGRIVFTDPAALADLEAITHPAVVPRIVAAMDAAEADGATAVVVEAIRLVDGGLAAACDEIWVVTCDPEAQLERVVGRGSDPADATRRIEAQAAMVERMVPLATRVIDTSGTIEATRALVDAAFEAAITP